MIAYSFYHNPDLLLSASKRMSVGEVFLAAFVGIVLFTKLSAPELWKFINKKKLSEGACEVEKNITDASGSAQ